MPRVTIALAVHNGAATLEKALKSALDQTFRDFEVLVVDDGSTDHSASIAEGLRCRVVQQANTGLGGARKRLVEEAEGELVAFLDHDDFWVPDKLERQLLVLEESGAAMVHSDCRFHYEDTGEVKTRLARVPGPDAFDHILPTNLVIASSAVFHRDAMLEAGNFIAETVRCSDWYGWFVLGAQNRFVHFPEVQVEYTVRSSSLANAGYAFHKAQHDLLKEQIVPKINVLFERCSPRERRRYRRLIDRNIGIAASSMAKYLGRIGRREEAAELHREAVRLAGTVPRVLTRALKSRLRR